MYSTELYFLVYKFVGFGMMQKFNYFLDKAFFPYQYEFKIYYSYLKIVVWVLGSSVVQETCYVFFWYVQIGFILLRRIMY